MIIVGSSFKVALLVFVVIIAISMIIDLAKSRGKSKSPVSSSKKTKTAKKTIKRGEQKGVLNPEDPRTAKLYANYPFLKEKENKNNKS
jgi:hypothetical protein